MNVHKKYISGVKDKLSYPAVTICNEAALTKTVNFLFNESFFSNQNVSIPLRLLHETVSVCQLVIERNSFLCCLDIIISC